MAVRSKAEAQRRADDIACFRRELERLREEGRGSRLEPRIVAASASEEGR